MTEETNPTGGDESQRVDLDAKLEAEIEAALGDMSIGDMLGTPHIDTSDDPGVKTGTVVSVHGKDVLVEFGPRSQGVCPLDQFESPPNPGERIEFAIDHYAHDEGLLILNRKGARRKAAWDSLAVGQVVEGRCIGMVKGGLEVEIAHHKGFMPAGQVDVNFVKDISVFLNEKITVEVMQLDKRRGRMVVSRRKVVAREREERRKELTVTLQVGKKLTAVISSIQSYGAFADIGGMDGLIHVSDMSYHRINHPKEAVKEGDQVEVQILKLELDRDPPRVSLGMKQCMADPFTTKANELTEGETVTGTVTRTADFGAFVEIAPGVEGLVHISQLAHERVNKVEHVVKKGETVTCQVVSVDPDSRRIGLSIKALKDAPRGSHQRDDDFSRQEDPQMRKLKAQLNAKFGENLKGGLF